MKSFACRLMLCFYNDGECVYRFNHEQWLNQFPIKDLFDYMIDSLQLTQLKDSQGYCYDIPAKQVKWFYELIRQYYSEYYDESKANAIFTLLKDYDIDEYFARISDNSYTEWELRRNFALNVLEFDKIKVQYSYKDFPVDFVCRV